MRNMPSYGMRGSPFGMIAGILSIIGALNWGLVGLFNFNVVRSLFGPMSTLSRFVYTLVGISGLFLLFSLFGMNPQQSGMPPQSRGRFSGMGGWWR